MLDERIERIPGLDGWARAGTASDQQDHEDRGSSEMHAGHLTSTTAPP
jgi:hypothetical protein